jgi:hypothetical protein
LQAHLAETEARRQEASGRHTPSQPPPPRGDAVRRRADARGRSAERPGAGRRHDASPVPALRARELMAIASERDQVFMALCAALRSKARWAGLLTVQGGAAIGRVALAEPGLDTTAMASVLIPLDVASPFRATITACHPYVGPLSIGNADLDVMLARMGGVVPPAGLLLPIVLRDRTVALAVAHRGPGDDGAGRGDRAVAAGRGDRRRPAAG